MNARRRTSRTVRKSPNGGSDRTLSSLISQVLAAYTVEFDNEFERRMAERGFPGSRLSLVIWARLIRFIPESGVTIGDLRRQTQETFERLKHELGCLERWGFVVLRAESTVKGDAEDFASPKVRHAKRDGWGSGRGIRGQWNVRLTNRGLVACEVWQPLLGEIDRRWETRFGGGHIRRLRQSLESLAALVQDESRHRPGRDLARDLSDLPLPGPLSRVLSAFAREFARQSSAALSLCANTIRVLGESPISVADLPRLTGGSPEMCGIGWQLKPYVIVERDPSRTREKVVRLSPRGLKAQRDYHYLVGQIDAEWEARFGKRRFGQLRESLLAMFAALDGKPAPIVAGLIPPPGVARAGAPTASLGRREVGPAARQRMRDLVAQTEAFIRDPAHALPHFPLWDMNRGFGL